jgi:hypothetical protein
VQAELNEGSALFGQYLPTYHISALTWQEATPVLPLPNWTIDIIMIPGTPVNSGEGVISGNVTSIGTREAMENVEVLLMNESMEPYTYARSDENGDFSFEELAFGNYMIYAELMGVNTTPVMITLHEDQSEAWVEVRVAGNEASYTLSIPESLKQLTGFSQVYPNPARDMASVEITSESSLELDMRLFNQLGQPAWSTTVDLAAGTHRITIPAGQLPSGFYYLQATTSQGDYVTRRVVISH